METLEERKVEVRLILTTDRNPSKIKGLDSTVGAIVDGKNNLVCLAPLTQIEWVFESLTSKEKTDKFFDQLSRQNDDELALCTICKRNTADADSDTVDTESNVIMFRGEMREVKKVGNK
jgi:hypothetical protein